MRVTHKHLVPALCVALLIGLGQEVTAQAALEAVAGANVPALYSEVPGPTGLMATDVTDVVSREVAVLTDAPVTPREASSREWSVLSDLSSLAIQDVTSRETSVLTDPGASTIGEANSREVAALVDRSVAVPSEASSREVAVLTDLDIEGVRDFVAREVSVHVDPFLIPTTEAISREVSSLVDPGTGPVTEASTREVAILTDAAVGVAEATSREISALVDAAAAAIGDASTREVAVLVDPLQQGLSDANSRELSVLTIQSEVLADASSREVSVLTGIVTPTLLTMMTTTVTAEGIEVRWEWGILVAIRSTALERANSADGPFEAIPVNISFDSGAHSALDRSVASGQTYWYRLVVETEDQVQLSFGPISATAMEPITDVILAPIAPNPTAGQVVISFAVPREMHVRISVFDVLGREAAVMADEPYGQGWHSGTWNLSTKGGRAAAGIYFVRLQTKEKTLTRRVAVSN